jgi:hypothetical protein
MDLSTRKIRLIRELSKLNNESIIEKLENTLHQEKKKILENNLNEMSIEEFNSIIDQAEDDSKNNRLYNAAQIIKVQDYLLD